jgi:hypothetical protein
MAKTYNTLGTVAPGDVLRANSGTAAYNGVITNVNNYRVPPMVRAVRTSDAAFTSGNAITFQSVSSGDTGFDTDGMWSAGEPTRITFQTAGVYRVTFGWFVTGTSLTTNQSYIRLGGTTLLAGFEAAVASNGGHSGNVSVVFNFAASNFVEGVVTQTGTSLQQRSSTVRSFLSATWLGQSS